MGESDNITPLAESADFLEKFGNVCERVVHPGGHFLPAASAQKQVYLTFLKNMMQKILEDEQDNLPIAHSGGGGVGGEANANQKGSEKS